MHDVNPMSCDSLHSGLILISRILVCTIRQLVTNATVAPPAGDIGSGLNGYTISWSHTAHHSFRSAQLLGGDEIINIVFCF
jgi:hypothetical protein